MLGYISHSGSQTVFILWHRKTKSLERMFNRSFDFQVLLPYPKLILLHGHHSFLLHCTNRFILLNFPSVSLLARCQTENYLKTWHCADNSEAQAARTRECLTTIRAPEEDVHMDTPPGIICHMHIHRAHRGKLIIWQFFWYLTLKC